MSSIRARIKTKSRLYAQLLFTALAFILMVALSYLFASGIVHNYMSARVDSVINSEQLKLEYELSAPVGALGVFSETVRARIINGVEIDGLESYFDIQTSYIIEKSQNSFINIIGYYGYFETLRDGPLFVNGFNWDPPDDYEPTSRPWYIAAVAAGADTAETTPYIDANTGELVLTYARCIYDDDMQRIGVIAIDILFYEIGQYIVNTAFTQGGYGMLLDQDLTILAHPNNEFLGLIAGDSLVPLSEFVEDLRSGRDVSERQVTSFRGEASIAFFRRLNNGWYIGLITPRGPFYRSVTTMAIVLSALGAGLATALMLILIRIDAAREKSDTESRHKSAFLANMSHEIRTPMNAIIGMTIIGKSTGDVERKDYCLSKIDDASQHLLGVINDILDMSKIEANKLDLASTEFNFEKMLQRIVSIINFRMDEKQHKFTIHIDEAIPKTLVGDDQRLGQVLTNLLGNAIKFTPRQGSISLRTRFMGEEDGVCAILFTVTDSGIGISPKQQENLFLSFQQADTDTTRKYGGTGLGLAISKRIVEMMGGTIWVDSEFGKGSVFSFTIRAKRGEGKAAPTSGRNINWKQVRALIVDDDPDILQYFSEVMQEFGLPCDTARGSEEAMGLIEEKGPYSIYFLDWIMPEMDGLALADALHAQSLVHDDAVFIMVSAVDWRSIEDRARESGISKFLSKPLYPSAIADAINEVLGADPRHVESPHPDVSGIFPGRRILLAEDVDINREIVMALLEPTLLEIDCAANGAQAVQMFFKSPGRYDLILMDLQMPEMDGYEATRKIRASEFPRARTVPILAMTANVFREDVEKCIASGMDGHVGKPIDYDELMEKLRLHILT